MRSRIALSLLFAVSLVAASGCSSSAQPEHSSSQGADFPQIERGRYLTIAADCAACHTMPHSGQPFAGGRLIETPFGNVAAPNITPDPQTGIGAWSDAEFEAALREGKDRHGARLYPAMPFPYYTKLTKADVLAIRAYLRTVAPVSHRVVANQLPFPFRIRSLMLVWDSLYFKAGEFKSNPGKSEQWNRGAYLVEAAAHCGACHTPKSMLGGDKNSRHLQGSTIQGWWAPDITNGSAYGLSHWDVADLTHYLKTGHNLSTAATGPMAEEVSLSSSHLTDSDLEAIAMYLKDQPGDMHSSAAIAQTDAAMKAGAAIYRDECSTCHAGDGNGSPQLFPALARSPAVHASDPTSLVRVVLRGARSVATDAEPTSPGMPAFGWQLSDQQVADVLTYVRNNWGAGAPAVSESEVRKARSSLAARAD